MSLYLPFGFLEAFLVAGGGGGTVELPRLAVGWTAPIAGGGGGGTGAAVGGVTGAEGGGDPLAAAVEKHKLV